MTAWVEECGTAPSPGLGVGGGSGDDDTTRSRFIQVSTMAESSVSLLCLEAGNGSSQVVPDDS